MVYFFLIFGNFRYLFSFVKKPHFLSFLIILIKKIMRDKRISTKKILSPQIYQPKENINIQNFSMNNPLKENKKTFEKKENLKLIKTRGKNFSKENKKRQSKTKINKKKSANISSMQKDKKFQRFGILLASKDQKKKSKSNFHKNIKNLSKNCSLEKKNKFFTNKIGKSSQLKIKFNKPTSSRVSPYNLKKFNNNIFQINTKNDKINQRFSPQARNKSKVGSNIWMMKDKIKNKEKKFLSDKENIVNSRNPQSLPKNLKGDLKISPEILKEKSFFSKYFSTKNKYLNSFKHDKKKNVNKKIFDPKILLKLNLSVFLKFVYNLIHINDLIFQKKIKNEKFYEKIKSILNKKNENFILYDFLNKIQKYDDQIKIFFKVYTLFNIFFTKGSKNMLKKLNLKEIAKISLQNFLLILNLLRKYFKIEDISKFKKIKTFMNFHTIKKNSKNKNIILKLFYFNNLKLQKVLQKFLSEKQWKKDFQKIQKTLSQKKPLKSFTSEITQILKTHQKTQLLSESIILKTQLKKKSPETSISLKNIFNKNNEPNFILQPLKTQKYLPPLKSRKYTLVLDLDETLIHFEEDTEGGQFLLRPFSNFFLQKLSKCYEIVIFTAAVKDYADWILDRIDQKKLISYRLYRKHTVLQNGVYLKDLSKLGRDLAKTLIVDNHSENFQLQPENGIYVKSWFNDPEDVALKQLATVLEDVCRAEPRDIRLALNEYHEKIVRKYCCE